MSRTAIVGDVHGMSDELERLLEGVALEAGDQLVSVGDLVRKGPDTRGVFKQLRKLQRLGISVAFVLGNHEAKLWYHLHGHRRGGKSIRKLLDQLHGHDRAWIAAAPLHLELPEHGVRVLHGGVLPGWKDLPAADAHTAYEEDPDRMDELLRARRVTAPDRPDAGSFLRLGAEVPGDPNWCEIYDGRFGPIYFGHQPFLGHEEPVRFPHATALDLGCVYGGSLAAVVLEDGAEIGTIQVRAGRAYAEWAF